MYIRQTTLFSFEEIISFQQETKLEMIFSQLDISTLASSIRKSSSEKGPKGYDPVCLIYSLLAMQVERIPTIKDLVLKLKENPILRYSCGFEVLGKTPSESTFSRFLEKLAESNELETLFHDLVIKAKEQDIIDGNNVSIDSTKLNCYEAAVPKSKIIDDGTHPNWGMKRDTNGNNIRWFGWKLHILCDCKSELPLDIKITPASVHDGTVAIPLIKQFKNHYKNHFNTTYYSMDSGYDYDYIYNDIVNKFQGIPIIAYNPRGSYAPPEGLDEDFDPIYSAGYKLVYWRKDSDYIKFRCPHAVGRCNCPHGMTWCSNSNYGYTLKLNYKENPRLNGYPLRSSKQWQKQYNSRTSVERCNSRLKEYLNTDNIRSKGIKKAKMHALLNCIVLISGTIALNIKNQIKKVA
ncbi:transposase [Crassaminicella indica]|uniref:Transposase n=1 Tax=Crassaminicella indica TaxID=2855394 RepID=A0ABX8RGC0_9CLOT|nr:transposase [Crassaminicella indica]QXM06950.1 transposase [Crassaminicella indica]